MFAKLILLQLGLPPLPFYISVRDVTSAERFLIVDVRPPSLEDCLLLENRSAVVCSVSDVLSARAIAAGIERLEVRRFSTLSEADQNKVATAFRVEDEAE